MSKDIQKLQGAIRKLHGCESTYVETVPVHEQFNGQTVWRGEVEVFDLTGHPKAVRCYAWIDLLETAKSQTETYKAVLQLPPVMTPQDAVKASIVAEHKPVKLEEGKCYKTIVMTREQGKNGMGEGDVIYKDQKAYLVLEWWPDFGLGEAPKVKVELDASLIQKSPYPQYDLFYRGQIPIPSTGDN